MERGFMPLPYLAAELRAADPYLYLLSLFARADRREALWALFLFKCEIAKTRGAVSDTTLGLIRLQWWRDEIGKIHQKSNTENCGKSPILSTLARAVRTYDLPLEDFETLIYAHEFDLEDVAPANVEGLHHYADFTTTPLFKLALKIMGEEVAEEDIRKASINYGLLHIIRNVPVTLGQGRCYLPEDLIVAQGLTPQKIINSNHKEDVIKILLDITILNICIRYDNCHFFNKILAFNCIYLKFLMKNGFDVFSAKVQAGPPFFAVRLIFGGGVSK
jgi:phytoene/squalene synthetase